MANERKTEKIARELLTAKKYYNNPTINVEEQQSDNPIIKKILKNASKSGNGAGYPEFIITSSDYTELAIVIECKSDSKKHESADRSNFKDYAVDGVLLYSSYLSKEYDVVSIAISGEEKNNYKLSQYVQLKGSNEQIKILESDILSFEEYYEWLITSDHKYNQDYASLIRYTKELNDELHDKKIKESQRALLISGILIALKNEAFKSSYKKEKKVSSLINSLFKTIENELTEDNIPGAKVEVLTQAFSFLKTNTTLNDEKKGKEFLVDLIDNIDKKINGFMQTYEYVDTVSQFYIEFLRYANHDKGLGIVLTPIHITDLFCEIAEVNKNSIVFDNCCGTGGFIIAAMKKMLKDANGDKEKEKAIKSNQIVGIEFQDDIFTLLVSNMIIHKDGRSNIFWGSCFDLIDNVKKNYKPTVGLLNPPFKTKKTDKEEFAYIMNNLESIVAGGKCVALVPISCVTATSGSGLLWKEQLMSKHTIEAVMSLPEELFHNSKASTVTCAIVITAHKKHPEHKETWLGYWRNDGFRKNKIQGRADLDHIWENTKKYWLSTYFNRKEVPGYSVMRKLTAFDEWCVEAYLETDYESIDVLSFEDTVKKYIMFNLMQQYSSEVGEDDET